MRSVFSLRSGELGHGGRLLAVGAEVESEQAESGKGYGHSSSPQSSVEVVDMKTWEGLIFPVSKQRPKFLLD